jgi:hypothetical protein
VPERIKEADALYEAQYRRMTDLLSKYSEEEFAAIIDFIERTTLVLSEEADRLHESGVHRVAKSTA